MASTYHIGILINKSQHVLNSSLALGIHASGEFANETFLAIAAEPGRRRLEPLRSDGAAHAFGMGS